MRIDIKADFKKAAKDVNQWSQKKLQRIQDTVNESAINIQAGAKRRANVDSGRLRSSITIEPANGPGFSLRVGTKVFYAPYVEFGTGRFVDVPDSAQGVPKTGRKTPWAFPVSKAGKKEYGFKRIEIDGKEFYVTRGSKPHPFLFPAFEEEHPKYLAAMRRAMQ